MPVSIGLQARWKNYEVLSAIEINGVQDFVSDVRGALADAPANTSGS
jgi:hypothetical protein